MIKRVDENGNVRLITNIRKPRKWKRFEYLESSGTLYIDTGIKLSLTDKFEFETDFTYSPANNRACPFYGTENYLTGFMAQYHYTNNNLYPLWIKNNSYGGANIAVDAESRMYSKTIIDIPNKTWAWIYNSTSANGTYSNLITDTTSTVKFFGNDLYNKYVAKCYYFKIIKNSTLIKHFVPAQYNGQYGMWDLVEDKFYPNKGTGIFTVGPEIKNYDEIYEVKKAYSILPSGVELYDYILSSGTLRIDTGIVPDMTLDTYFKVETLSGALDSSPIIGARVGSSNPSRYFPIAYFAANSTLRATLGNAEHVFSYTNGIYEGNFLPTQLTSTINGTTRSLSSNGFTKTENNTLQIFGTTGYGTNYYYTKAKVYYVKLVRNGQVLRNMLPCTYLGEPGMWDTVENKFYRNQGIGLFTLGNKITLKEYEYLESSKTQWIDSNFYPNLDSGSELKVQILPSSEAYSKLLYTDYTSINEGSILWGWDINNTSRFRAAYYKNLIFIMNGKFNNNDVYLLKIDKNIYSINGITVLTNSTINFLSSSTVKLFARKKLNGSISDQSAMRLYYCKFYNDNQLVRDFIPISYNGTPGLWDKVEWKFYANAGSGSFTLGPEKASGTYPVSYLYDRTIYEEPDGSKWLRIAHHNGPNTRRFTSSDSFTTYIHTNEHLFFDVSWCNTFTLWELMVKLKTTSGAAELKFRWIQNYNPMTATFDNTKKANVIHNTSSGYTVPSGNWGGLMKLDNTNTYLCGNNGTNGNWWGATGCKILYSGGLPGWNGLMVTTGYLDLYIRIA